MLGSTLFSAESGGDVSEEDKELAVSHCCLLLDCVLQCLSKCFLYDRTEFMTRERFDAILQPLVNQVSCLVLLTKKCSILIVIMYFWLYPVTITET